MALNIRYRCINTKTNLKGAQENSHLTADDLRLGQRSIEQNLVMNAADMISHVVHSSEHSFATFPFARDTWAVLRFVTGAILISGEGTLFVLRAALEAAGNRFDMPPEMFAQVTTSDKDRLRGAAGISASPASTVR